MTTKQPFTTAFFFVLFLTCTSVTKAQQADFAKADSVIKNVLPDSLVFEKTEIEASVDAALWRKHLEANLGAYLEDASRRGMKKGLYTVAVRFLVEKSGRVSQAVALSDPGFGLGKAAVTVIKTGPRWQAGEVNGKKVRSYHTQPITFQIIEK